MGLKGRAVLSLFHDVQTFILRGFTIVILSPLWRLSVSLHYYSLNQSFFTDVGALASVLYQNIGLSLMRAFLLLVPFIPCVREDICSEEMVSCSHIPFFS